MLSMERAHVQVHTGCSDLDVDLKNTSACIFLLRVIQAFFSSSFTVYAILDVALLLD